jgi:aspartate-semialdehyde dehydrogenase
MLGLPDQRVIATCVRVPVVQAHSASVQIETTDKITAEAARNLLMVAPGVTLVDEPGLNLYPLPRDAHGRDEVLVGRIREDSSHPRGLVLWFSSDNLRKGAATNAVQIAESLVTKGWL